MTTIQQPKALTVKQYEFYKRKGMTDAKVMELHGFNNAAFYAWKEANNLKGVKFEKDVKVTKSSDMGNVSTSSSVDSKSTVFEKSTAKQLEVEPRIDKSDSQTPRPTLTPADLQILAEQVKPHSGSPVDDSTDTDNRVDLKDAEIEELKKQIIWLEERHVKDTARIDESNAKRYDEIARADNWREKCRITEMELRDKGCETEKLKEQHYIQLCNLQNDVCKANEALELHHHDEQLLFQTMKKLVTVSDRLNETVEGGKDLWR